MGDHDAPRVGAAPKERGGHDLARHVLLPVHRGSVVEWKPRYTLASALMARQEIVDRKNGTL
jgi:hypothetical protein